MFLIIYISKIIKFHHKIITSNNNKIHFKYYSKNNKILNLNLKKNALMMQIQKFTLFLGIYSNINNFLKNRSQCFKNKLTKCYIYNAPFVFSQILNIVSLFIDKETQTKIQLVQKK